MTTIIADAKAGIMVSDSNTSDGEIKWPTRKIERIGDSLFGFAGEAVEIQKMLRWLNGGRKGKKPKTKECSGLELSAEGVFLWDDAPISYSPDRHYHAVGSGAMAALAAMQCGKTAQESVDIACQIDAHSEGPIQVVRLNDE